MDVGMDPIDARIVGADHEQDFQAVSLWIKGKHIGWVDLSGVYHEDTWDPFEDELCFNLPK